jgi:hypothetical protein
LILHPGPVDAVSVYNWFHDSREMSIFLYEFLDFTFGFFKPNVRTERKATCWLYLGV